jgi:predicted chitinase
MRKIIQDSSLSVMLPGGKEAGRARRQRLPAFDAKGTRAYTCIHAAIAQTENALERNEQVDTTMDTTKKGAAAGTDEKDLFTVDQLAKISQNPDPVYYDLAGDRAALIPEMKKAGIVTRNQIMAFLANISQETDHLKTLEEYGTEAYFRSFLGAEWRYHGRGYIMNTWRAAYQRLSHVLGVDLVSNPDLLAKRKDLAARAAVWYWTVNKIGPVADRGDFKGVCSLIQRGETPPRGPINGWDERLAAYERAKTVIRDKPTLKENGSVSATETETEPETDLLTAKEGTNFRKGLDYIRPIVGHREYWVWSGGAVPAGEGMYAVNEPLHPVAQIGRINCAGTTNLFFRAMRKKIPTKGNPLYDGGVAAYAGGVFGPGYFEGYSEPFDLAKAKKWAQETRCGVLLLRPYWNASLSGQGHVAILLPSGYVLQSFVNVSGPDLNWDYTIEQSNEGGYYKAMVHPENWSEYEGDEW